MPETNLFYIPSLVSKNTANNVGLSLLLSTSRLSNLKKDKRSSAGCVSTFHQHVVAVRLILFQTPAVTSARCCFIIHYRIFIHSLKFCSNYPASHNILASKWLIFTHTPPPPPPPPDTTSWCCSSPKTTMTLLSIYIALVAIGVFFFKKSLEVHKQWMYHSLVVGAGGGLGGWGG